LPFGKAKSAEDLIGSLWFSATSIANRRQHRSKPSNPSKIIALRSRLAKRSDVYPELCPMLESRRLNRPGRVGRSLLDYYWVQNRKRREFFSVSSLHQEERLQEQHGPC